MHNRLFWSLFACIPATFLVSLCVGAYPVGARQMACVMAHRLGVESGCMEGISQNVAHILWFIRLPRVLLAMLIGTSLAVAGAAVQGLFRNPLADPGLIGISSGGMLSAALAILLGWDASAGLLGYYGLSIFAFLGAITATLLVFYLSELGGRSTSVLLLAGIAINALAGALTSLIIYLSDDAQLRGIVFWTLGSLGGANWTTLLVFIPLGCLPLFLIAKMARQLDIYALGDADASCVGVDVHKLKVLLIFSVTLSVATGVAFVGIIGFVGLVVPHIARLLFGHAHRRVVAGSALLGALLLALADSACRVMVSPAELPIGILTATMGAPLFIALLMRQRRFVS